MRALIRDEEGWTFLETLIAVAVIVTLTGTVGVTGLRFVSQAKQLAARSQIESYALAVHTYALDCGRIPTAGQGLEALWQRPTLEPVPEQWAGPYLTREVAADPWGRPYEYRVPGPDGLEFGIISYGADGRPGGEGEAADVTSWSK
jgi:general secretion pathway protein G